MKTITRKRPYKNHKLFPHEITNIIEGKAAGFDVNEIARATGVNRRTVADYANKPDIKAKIEAVQARLANEAYEQVATNLVEAVKDVRRLEEPDPVSMQRRDQGFKASVKIAESMGILPSHSQSILVQQVFNTQVNHITPNVARLLEIANADIIEED